MGRTAAGKMGRTFTFRPASKPNKAVPVAVAETREARTLQILTVSDKPAASEWVVEFDIENKLEQAKAYQEYGDDAWPKLSIYRIPKCLRHSDKNAYSPHTVSLGPYHHGKRWLLGMEWHKWRALHQVLKRTRHSITKYLDAVKEIEEDACACYEGPVGLSSDAFIEMLLLDSTFALELFRGADQGFQSLGYSRSDPVFTMRAGMTSIQRDMILLENQIPLFVLNDIHAIQGGSGDVTSLVLRFFEPLVPTSKALPSATALSEQGGLPCLQVFRRGLLAVRGENKAEHVSKQRAEANPIACANQEMGQERREGQSQQHTGPVADKRQARAVHCLDVFRRSLLAVCEENKAKPVSKKGAEADPVSKQGSEANPIACANQEMEQKQHEGQSQQHKGHVDKRRAPMIHCVTQLKEAGVKFTAIETNKICDISFNNGVLKIPRLLVQDGTKSLFLNLIAFEQCHLDCTNDITSYAGFMDDLIDSPADVAYLRHCRIVDNYLGSNVEVSNLFNSLCHEVAFDRDDSWHSKLTKEINKYYGKSWNEWRANLMHKYFNNPWSSISLIAASFLVLLTFAQTFYAVYAYYAPPS